MSSWLRLSRRNFLRLAPGVALPLVAGRRSETLSPLYALDDHHTLARSLGLNAVYAEPDPTSTIIGHLAPDSVHPICVRGAWYQTEHGYSLRTTMQPIQSYQRPQIAAHDEAPFWAEVIAPVSPFRTWCSGRAPIVAAWGYGGVTNVLGTLTDDYGIVWYETDYGWVDARQWQRVATGQGNSQSAATIQFSADGRMIVQVDGYSPWQTAFYGGVGLPDNAQHSRPVRAEQPADRSGKSWLMRLSSGRLLSGVWNHNTFGLAGGSADLELSMIAAKRLFQQLVGTF